MITAQTEYIPATDTFSNEYRLDCLAKYYLATKSNADIRAMLEKKPDLKSQLAHRLNYFKPVLQSDGLLFNQHKPKQKGFRSKAPKAAAAGLRMARQVIRSKVTNGNVLKERY